MPEKEKNFQDAYFSSFHGFDKLEKEFRADGCYQGKASHFAKCKEELIRSRPRSRLDTHVSECFMAGPKYKARSGNEPYNSFD